MATATKPRPKGEDQTEESLLSLPAEFGGFSCGDSICRISLRIPRQRLSIGKADSTLCGRRLTGRIIVVPSGYDPKQQSLEGMEDEIEHDIEGTFDVAKFSVSPKFISFSLSFNMADVEIEELVQFSKKSGYVFVNAVDSMPEKKRGPKKKDDAGSDLPGQKKILDPKNWDAYSLARIGLPSGIVEKLAESNLKTLGQIMSYVKAGKLTNIDGIGQGKADAINAALDTFWKANPEAAELAAK